MKRRRWLDLVGRAGIAALLPGCARRVPEGLDLTSMDQLGGEAYGVWKSGRRVAGREPGKRMPSFSITKSLAGLDAAAFQDLAAPRKANPMVSAGIWWNRNATRMGAFPIEPERHLNGVRPPSFWQAACLDPELDPGWLAMVGSGGKRVYVLPSRGWVIVRLARSTRWNDGAFLQTITFPMNNPPC